MVHRSAAVRLGRPRTRRRPEPCQTTTVDARVLKAALKAAGGDPSRLRILGPRTVLVADNRYAR